MASVSLMNSPLPHFPAMSLDTGANVSSSCTTVPSLILPKRLEVKETNCPVRVETDRPHLVSLGGGRLSTAVTIHPLPEGLTYIGKGNGITPPDIVVQGTGIEDSHCYIENVDNVVRLFPVAVMVSIDGMKVNEPTRLTQGSMICLGRSTFFRFNHPQEAKLIKQILPSARISIAPSAFQPVLESDAGEEFSPRTTLDGINFNKEYNKLPLESSDFVEKVSKFEYLAHSLSPPVTSQDTPKWFVREGIRFPSQPWSQNSTKAAPAVPPKPSNDYRSFSTPRQSRTPEPISKRHSPIHFWSGRCTPETEHFNGNYGAHDDYLKAREDFLELQHRKVVEDRMQDENEKLQEEKRLENILNMCAEFDNGNCAMAPSTKILAENFKPMVSNSSVFLPSGKCSPKFASKMNGVLPSPCSTTPPHTRIKTNGSLPRERSHKISVNSTSDTVDGAVLIVNHKALTSASSEDELTAILGEFSPTSSNEVFYENNLTTSPNLFNKKLMNSPRTGIRTIAARDVKMHEPFEKQQTPAEFYENHAVSFNCSSPNGYHPEMEKGRLVEILPIRNSHEKKLSTDGDVLHILFTRKMNSLKRTSSLKQKICDLESHESEAIRELELEFALLSGEQKEEEQDQMDDNNRLKLLRGREKQLNEEAERAKKDEQMQLEAAKEELREQEQVVAEMRKKLEVAEEEKKAEAEEHYRHALEILEAERKGFEDLEFQQLESQTHREEEKEAIIRELGSSPLAIREREKRLEDLSTQQKALALQIVVEKELYHKKKVDLFKLLSEQQEELEKVESDLRNAVRIPYTTESFSSSSATDTVRVDENKVNVAGVWIGKGEEWRSERDAGCQSFHSVDSETSSMMSSDALGESLSSGEDSSRPSSLQSQTSPDEQVRQKEHLLSLTDDKPLVDHSRRSPSVDVKRRDKQKAQRPLTRYLPIRNPEFDLRHHVESAGHQIELCPHVHITSTYCKGYLQKLGGKWPSWKKRWFVFDRVKRALLYYSDKSEHKLRGGIYFQSIEEVYVDHLHSVKSANPHATFCMKTDSRVYYLTAPNPEAMRIWVDVIFTGAEGYLEFLADMDS